MTASAGSKATPILVVTPAHRTSAALAIAANRAGETGLLDLGYSHNDHQQRREIRHLRAQSRSGSWGIRWDGLDSAHRSIERLIALMDGERVPILALGGVAGDEANLAPIRQSARSIADIVLYEVLSADQADAAEPAGFDGVIARGFEAGGRVSLETTFGLLQRLSGRLKIPFWAQGGIGPDTAASALLAGAAGVVLCEQLWLASESSLSASEKARAASGNFEIVSIGSARVTFRVGALPDRSDVSALAQHTSESNWTETLVERLADDSRLVPTGQDVTLSDRLAREHVNVAGIIRAYRLRSRENFKMACRGEALAPQGPFADSHRIKYPIVQGPMTGVTNEPAFALEVAQAGGLPILALGGLDVDRAHALLTQTQVMLEELPWGAAVPSSAPENLQKAYVQLLAQVKPPVVMMSARQIDLADRLSDRNIAVYFSVGSADLLEPLLTRGVRRFVVEGNECGGHLGQRTSFSLWQDAIDILLSAKLERPSDVHLIFAGPIHDSLSSAMTAAAVAPLTARGMKVGVQVASAYFFTPQAVKAGIITELFHQKILSCQEITYLKPGLDPTIRCVPTPFVDEFNRRRSQAISEGVSPAALGQDLTELATSRLALAAKGMLDGRDADPATQEKLGLFRVGEVAVLRDRPIDIADLHEIISQESVVLLEKLASQRLPWHPESRPNKPKSEDIAIVGMSAMFPKADDLRAYWENICRAVDAIEEVASERWDPDLYFDEDRLARDRVYSKWGGFLNKVVFDPMKYRIPPAALKAIEPIQLLALEIATRAMADAGYDRREFPRERTGVLFACAGSHDLGSSYAFRTMFRHYLSQVEGLSPEVRAELDQTLADEVLPEWTEDSFPGFLLNVVAGRVARELNVNGPNYTVDAACAASLAAFHAAIEQLRSGTSDMVLVGGVDWGNNPMCYMSFSKTHALSPRGRSRPFDETGDGIALGEGIGVVILKRLRDAERDGDKIYAVIKGIGSSSDGKNKSLTAPYPPGQIKAVERAYDDAQLCPTTVSLVEAHGTGTVVGDSAEITTLTEVFGSRTEEKQFAAVGSVKSMIGHTKTVAGMASMIKTALALKHRVLPPTIGVDQPTSRFDFANSPFYVNTQTRPWIEDLGRHPRRAGVSAFGFGGTNFHVVLEEYTGQFLADADINMTPRSAELFAWAAQTQAQILSELSEIKSRLDEIDARDLGSLAASICRNHSAPGRCRLAIVATSIDDLAKKVQRALDALPVRKELVDPTGIFYAEADPVSANAVAFLYPGQGSQYVNMLRDLVVGTPTGQDVFSTANDELSDFLPKPLSRYIFPPPSFSEEEHKQHFKELSNTRVAQPALGVAELFATDLLMRFGLRPRMVAGHSYGEHVALHVAGVISREELVWLSAMRGQVCADIAADSPGGMAAVQANAETTLDIIRELELDVYLANMNAPDQTIIAASEADIEKAVVAIAAKGVRCKRIPVSAPFHTPLLEAGSHAMAEHFARASFQRPKIPAYSNTTGQRHADNPDIIRDLLTRHFSEPVRFEEEVRQMYADGARVFIEAGPNKILSELVGRILKSEPIVTLPIDVPGRDGWTQFGHAMARAFVLGLPVRVEEWFAGRGFQDETPAAYFERMRQLTVPKKSDWILGPSRAEPVTPTKNQKSAPSPRKSIIIEPLSAASATVPSGNPSTGDTMSSSLPLPPLVQAVAQAAPRLESTPPVARSNSVADIAPPKALTSGETPRQGGSFRRTLAHRPASSISLGTKGSLLDRRRPPERKLQTMSQQMHHSDPNNAAPAPAQGPELFIEFQQSTRMLLEFQHTQQLLMEKFLDTQERLLSMCLGQGGSVPAPAPSAAIPMIAPTPAPAPYVNGHASAPAPQPALAAPVAAPALVAPVAAPARPPVSVPSTRGPATSPPPIASAPAKAAAPMPVAVVEAKPVAPAPVSAPVAQAAPTPVAPASAPASAAAGGVPTVDEFRKDLLAVIGERTGYPEDMLDEELPLEAGLGIDSIKTVEIFSTLKRYHPFMRDEDRDEEETLAEFTRLKTIKDIIDAYRGRYEKLTAGGSANGSAKNGSVERHSLSAVAAPAGEGAGKKNSLASI